MEQNDKKTQIDAFHGQIIFKYLKTAEDCLKFIQIKKAFWIIPERTRINDIPVTEETMKLFQSAITRFIFPWKEMPNL